MSSTGKSRRKNFEPTPAGWLVTGHRLDTDYMVPRERCKGHLFLTGEPEVNTHWQSGFRQGATCIVCDEDVTPIDASWWLDIATPAKIRAARNLIKRKRLRLLNMLDLLESHAESGDYASA